MAAGKRRRIRWGLLLAALLIVTAVRSAKTKEQTVILGRAGREDTITGQTEETVEAKVWTKDTAANEAIMKENNQTNDLTQDKIQNTMRIALTFDDGPHPIYTARLLDGLKERNVKATFFLVGENVERNPELVRRMYEEGHLLGNHTYTHVQLTGMAGEDACEELEKTSEAVEEITGRHLEYVRPPFGSWDEELDCDIPMIPIFWTVDSRDWTTANVSEIVRRVVTQVKEDDIILMHDYYSASVDAALDIVDQLQAMGYEFVTADELIVN